MKKILLFIVLSLCSFAAEKSKIYSYSQESDAKVYNWKDLDFFDDYVVYEGDALKCLNFLTKRKNPTRIDFFNPPIYSPKKQIDEVIQKLDETKTKYIATFEFKYDEKNSFDKYLVENYKLIWENKFFRLYKRKSP